MEREKAAREYEELKRSIEDKKKGIIGMPTVSEARESYEMSVASKNSGRFTSTNPVRVSQENPIEDIPEMEVARNINDKNLANNNVPEEEEEYYDEESGEDLSNESEEGEDEQ